MNEIRKEQKEKSKKIKYDAGLEEVISNGSLTSEKNAEDSFGFRWLICTECGEIKREDEMMSYAGNVGLCRDCSRNGT